LGSGRFRLGIPFATGAEPDPPVPVDAVRPPLVLRQGQSLSYRSRTTISPVPPTGRQPALFPATIVRPADGRPPYAARLSQTPLPPTGMQRSTVPSLFVRPVEGLPPVSRLLRTPVPLDGNPTAVALLAPSLSRPPCRPPFPGRLLGTSVRPFATGLSAATSRTASGPPFLGGLRFTALEWLGVHALQVDFACEHADLCVQLYAGRSLIGHTTAAADRRLVAHLVPSDWPPPLQLLAVDPADVLADHSHLLPLRPYNRVRLDWTSSGMPSDTRLLEIAAGTAPGGAVDTDNVLDRVRYDRDRAYVWRSRPLAGSGTWHFEVAARDDRPGDGNRGSALALSATVLSMPPDVRLDASGRRLVVAVAAQTATVTFLEPE
jgi:hypothetical protein